MKLSKLRSSQDGIAHLGLILIIIVFAAVGSLVVWRFQSSNETANSGSPSIVSSEEKEEKALKDFDSALGDAEQDDSVDSNEDIGEAL